MDVQGIFEKGTVMQGILHNFGLWNAWKDGIEYNDFSTCMGMGDGCPSAPELWRLGWATPLALLNSATLPLGQFFSFVLPATYLGPTGVMIKIQPNWLGMFYTKCVRACIRAFLPRGAVRGPEAHFVLPRLHLGATYGTA
jgi:hypothetical protein